jgi:hypothetical protein
MLRLDAPVKQKPALPLWADAVLVVVVCVPFWGALTWLITSHV